MQIEFQHRYIENACRFLVAMKPGVWHTFEGRRGVGIKSGAGGGSLGHLVYHGFLERSYARVSGKRTFYKYKLTYRGEQVAGVLQRLGVTPPDGI